MSIGIGEKTYMNWTTWNRHLYAAWAPFYDILVSMLEDKRRRSLELAGIHEDEQVLLLGAGTGLDLNYLPRNLKPTAIDITPAMIRRLRQRAERLNMQVSATVMDGQALLFEDGTFDVVVLHFVLAVMPEPQRALDEAVRVLRPGGRLVILNKCMKDDQTPSIAVRCVNKISRLVATDITFKLKPVLNHPRLNAVHVEQVGFGGLFKIAILEKHSAPVDVPGHHPGVKQSAPDLPPASYTASQTTAFHHPEPAA